jgi:Holliday junction resolvasome RuvABC endonuclease subunit
VKTILAIDLGTTTGWAYRSRSGGITAGAWLLQDEKARKLAAKARLDRRLDARIPALYGKLRAVWADNIADGTANNPVDFLVFEDVEFSQYTLQTQLWSSLRAALWLFAHRHGIITDCINVKTLKKLATGSGGADKDFMIRTATKLFPNVTIVDDNCADALHLLQWAMTITKRSAK